MQLRALTKHEVWDLPLTEIQSWNSAWEQAIKQHDPNWTMEIFKGKSRDIKQFILSKQDYRELHYQFRWCEMTGQERMIEKFQERTYEKTKSHGYYDGGDHGDDEFLDYYYKGQ